MEDTSIYYFFLFTVDLDLFSEPPVAKMKQNPGGDEPASLGFAFLMHENNQNIFFQRAVKKVIYYEINLKQIQAS